MREWERWGVEVGCESGGESRIDPSFRRFTADGHALAARGAGRWLRRAELGVAALELHLEPGLGQVDETMPSSVAGAHAGETVYGVRQREGVRPSAGGCRPPDRECVLAHELHGPEHPPERERVRRRG